MLLKLHALSIIDSFCQISLQSKLIDISYIHSSHNIVLPQNFKSIRGDQWLVHLEHPGTVTNEGLSLPAPG